MERKLTETQDRLLTMLRWFHEYCKHHGLRYYVIGGTALGAARHQGFIPWDDDIDVGMPRPDYEKLKQLRQEQAERYLFEFPGKDDFGYLFGKLYDTTTTLIENTRYKTKRGLYLDIFPLDGIGNTKEASLNYFRKIDKKRNLFLLKTCAWSKRRKFYKNIGVLLMRCVPSFVMSEKKLREQIDALATKFDYDRSDYVANIFGAWHEKEIAKREWFGNPTTCCFEGLSVYCPQNIDTYLTALYGDWRTPPPPEKQVSHHDYLLIDLKHSYLD